MIDMRQCVEAAMTIHETLTPKAVVLDHRHRKLIVRSPNSIHGLHHRRIAGVYDHGPTVPELATMIYEDAMEVIAENTSPEEARNESDN